MKYFLDSAKIEEIRHARDSFGIDGVTTNPRHIMESGKPFLTVLKELAEEFKEYPEFPISVEINPHLDNAVEMVEEGKKIAALSSNFVIKIPCHSAGITAARLLEKEGIRTNVTLVFSPSQALIPAKNGSKFVSPFVGWKENSGENAFDYIRDIVKVYKNYGFESEVIVAALRNGFQIAEAAKAGAHIVTCSLEVYKASFEHPFTDYGLEVFTKAWDQTKIE